MLIRLQPYSFVAVALPHSDVLQYAYVRQGLSASLYARIRTSIGTFNVMLIGQI